MESKANMNIIHFVDGQYVSIIKRSFFAIKNLVELCPGNEDFLREFLSDRTIIL